MITLFLKRKIRIFVELHNLMRDLKSQIFKGIYNLCLQNILNFLYM